MTFMYWWMNFIQRMKVLAAKKWYVRDNPEATGYTVDDLKKMGPANLAKKMGSYTAKIPGTKANNNYLRRLLLAMVRQIEIETRDLEPEVRDNVHGGGSGTTTADATDGVSDAQAPRLGDVPCVFGTLASQRYHWDDIIRIIAEIEGNEDYKTLSKSKRRELVNKYPLFVSWYCAVRLELALKTIAVTYFGASAYVGVFEWSPSGGMVHLHYILWKRDAPRFDLRAEDMERKVEKMRKEGILPQTVHRCQIHDVVDFFATYITEWNANCDADGVQLRSTVAEQVNEGDPHTASWDVKAMLRLLQEGNDTERHAYYKKLVRTEHIHDFHYPDPTGPPNPSQPCARVMKGTTNMIYCANGYPRDKVSQQCETSIAQDPMRKDLWRCHLCRNDPLMNSHMPVVTFFNQANTDGQPVVTKHQAEMYLCKYCAKKKENHGARSTLYDVLDDMEHKKKAATSKMAKTAALDSMSEPTLGSKLHKAFMAEIGDEMCQAEVAHHANKCPEFFCSRPVRQVHIYRKALGLSTGPNKTEDWDEDWDWSSEDEIQTGGSAANANWETWQKQRRVTPKSDVDLYEGRFELEFEEGTELSQHLPTAATPEAQVQNACLYDFFRLVRYHGGKNPFLSWHAENAFPILLMYPSITRTHLAEGPDFAFGARWALMQFHPWVERRRFLEPSEEDVKKYFREWVETDACPWYLVEDYVAANKGKRRVRRPTKVPAAVVDEDTDADGQDEGDAVSESVHTSEEEDESGKLDAVNADDDTHVLRMLYKGTLNG